MERYFQILKVNLKHNLLGHILLILGLFLLAPFIMGMKNLDELQTARILEFYISFFGVILLIPLFMLDEDLSIRSLIKSKKESMLIIHLLRLIEQLLILLLAVFLFMEILKVENCNFDFPKLYFGTIANCVFLGGLGVLGFSIINSSPFAYMISIFYYMVCYCGKDTLGKFYLFSMSSGCFEDSSTMFAAGSIMILSGILYRNKMSGK